MHPLKVHARRDCVYTRTQRKKAAFFGKGLSALPQLINNLMSFSMRKGWIYSSHFEVRPLPFPFVVYSPLGGEPCAPPGFAPKPAPLSTQRLSTFNGSENISEKNRVSFIRLLHAALYGGNVFYTIIKQVIFNIPIYPTNKKNTFLKVVRI